MNCLKKTNVPIRFILIMSIYYPNINQDSLISVNCESLHNLNHFIINLKLLPTIHCYCTDCAIFYIICKISILIISLYYQQIASRYSFMMPRDDRSTSEMRCLLSRELIYLIILDRINRLSKCIISFLAFQRKINSKTRQVSVTF